MVISKQYNTVGKHFIMTFMVSLLRSVNQSFNRENNNAMFNTIYGTWISIELSYFSLRGQSQFHSTDVCMHIHPELPVQFLL